MQPQNTIYYSAESQDVVILRNVEGSTPWFALCPNPSVTLACSESHNPVELLHSITLILEVFSQLILQSVPPDTVPGLRFDLSNSLPGDTQFLANLIQRVGMTAR
jgi:hypothetical protein